MLFPWDGAESGYCAGRDRTTKPAGCVYTLVPPAGILEGYALGGISVFVFESWCGFHRHRQEAGHPRQSKG